MPIPDPAATMENPDPVLGHALESVRGTLDSLKLTPAEEQLLAGELGQLRDLGRKLEENTIEIVAFGMVGRGKSSLLNTLIGEEVFTVGATHGTTVSHASQPWRPDDATNPGLEGTKLILTDTPGIDEAGGDVREAEARKIARRADLILFVVSTDPQRRELESLSELRQAQKPIILVFNQIDRYEPADRDKIYAKIKDERVRDLIRAEDVVMTAARPDPYKVRVRLPDGSTRDEWERPAAAIEPLKVRIFDVLAREGKALAALNTLLLAGDLHAEIVARKVEIREQEANRLIWNFSMVKGAAVALNPIPIADLAGGVGVDVAMILALSRVYGIPLTRPAALRLVRDMSFALGAMGVLQLATKLLASGIKSALAASTVMTGGLAAPLTVLGYSAVGLSQASAAATASYVVGQGAKTYLKRGCQWGPRGVKTVIQEILVQAKADSIVDRLRADLKQRIKKS
jgi:small GTP-binding protein